MDRLKEYIRKFIKEQMGGATMNAQEMARHKKKLTKLKKYLAKQGDQMVPYPKSLPNTVFNAKLMNEDLRDWFGTGGKGGVGGGGWDRYNSSGDRIGKCGDAKEGEAYSACLSKEKAEKLGKAGRAAFVKRKRAAQAKGGDAKKGGEHKKGQKPIKVKTGVKEEMTPEQSEKIGMPFKGKNSRDLKETDLHSKLSRGHKPDTFQLNTSEFKPFDKSRDEVKKENLDPNTYTDKGNSAPYGSGYQKINELEKQLTLFLEKNTPTDKSKWSYYKSQAKKKFDVYPSAYANAWAAKMYKKAGGGWRKSK